MQTWLKLVSREPPAGRWHALTKDDAVFWIDWTVTAALALCSSLVAASMAGRPIGTVHVFAALGVLVLGLAVMPYAVRLTCYDGHGNIKSWGHVVCANALGALVLLSSVAAGVKTYG